MMILTCFILLSSLFYVCLSQENMFDESFKYRQELIDLSHPINNRSVSFPGTFGFAYTKQNGNFDRGFWVATGEFQSSEHLGTHLDAMYHFDVNGLKVGEIPLDMLMTRLVVIDVSWMCRGNADFILQKEMIQKTIASKLRRISTKVLLIFRYGWSKFYSDKKIYLGGSTVDTLHFPGISAELAQFILTEFEQVVGIGCDTPSMDPGINTRPAPAHRLILGSNRYIIENINFNETNERDFYNCIGFAFVPRYIEGTASGVRLVALCSY